MEMVPGLLEKVPWVLEEVPGDSFEKLNFVTKVPGVLERAL